MCIVQESKSLGREYTVKYKLAQEAGITEDTQVLTRTLGFWLAEGVCVCVCTFVCTH